MKNTNTTFETMNLSSEVTATLNKYNSAIDGALEAVQKLEAICVTAHLAEFFGTSQEKSASIISQDYLVAA